MEQKTLDRIQEIVTEIEPELKKLALDIHDNPELGRKEYKACKWQIELLTKYGFAIEENFCDIPTSYRASYKGKKTGPKMAMLTEYDALPGLGHGCGHNLIALVGAGSGIALREFVDEYGGEIDVIGTPAEETEGAKVDIAKAGAFKDYDVVMMAHPGNENWDSFNTLAIACRRFEFFGKTAHASGYPEEGLNALDAVINFFNMVNALRQQTKQDARIHGVILDGGLAPNIIPDHTEALFYMRAEEADYVDELVKKVTACAEGAALGTGTQLKVSKAEADFKDTKSSRVLSDLVCDQAEKLGQKITRLGDKVMPGSSDLGDVSHECPAVQLMFSMGTYKGGEYYGGHTVEFTEQAGSEEAMNQGLEFVKAFTMTGIELMTNPTHLKKIKAEFAEMQKQKTKKH